MQLIDTKDMAFVFGSNTEGRHGAGAAKAALLHHGAIYGQGEGPMGDCYGLPTVGKKLSKMNLAQIRIHVMRFLEFTKKNPKIDFQVTQVGCGLAGHPTKEIAIMFKGAPSNCFFDLAWEPHLGMENYNYWGTF